MLRDSSLLLLFSFIFSSCSFLSFLGFCRHHLPPPLLPFGSGLRRGWRREAPPVGKASQIKETGGTPAGRKREIERGKRAEEEEEEEEESHGEKEEEEEIVRFLFVEDGFYGSSSHSVRERRRLLSSR